MANYHKDMHVFIYNDNYTIEHILFNYKKLITGGYTEYKIALFIRICHLSDFNRYINHLNDF